MEEKLGLDLLVELKCFCTVNGREVWFDVMRVNLICFFCNVNGKEVRFDVIHVNLICFFVM